MTCQVVGTPASLVRGGSRQQAGGGAHEWEFLSPESSGRYLGRLQEWLRPPHRLSEYPAPGTTFLCGILRDTCIQGQWMMDGGVDAGTVARYQLLGEHGLGGGRPGQDSASRLLSSSRAVHSGLWDTRISE